MLFSLLVCYMSWWDSKSARYCQLHPSRSHYTRALRWICLNLFHKVNFPRKTKRCFNLRKSDSTEQPPVTKSSRKKGEGCTKHAPLAHCVLAGWVLTVRFDFKKLPDFPSCGNLCPSARSPGRTGAPDPHGVFPTSLRLPTSWPKGCSPVLHKKEQPTPSLHMASPTSS